MYVTNLFWRVHCMVYTRTIIVEPFCFLHRFKIESVYPGTYQVTASHPVWKISQVHVVTQDNLSMHTSIADMAATFFSGSCASGDY